MTIHTESVYVEPQPCCCCDDRTHTRPGWHGWKATDTDHPGFSASSTESSDDAIDALREALTLHAKFAHR